MISSDYLEAEAFKKNIYLEDFSSAICNGKRYFFKKNGEAYLTDAPMKASEIGRVFVHQDGDNSVSPRIRLFIEITGSYEAKEVMQSIYEAERNAELKKLKQGIIEELRSEYNNTKYSRGF